MHIIYSVGRRSYKQFKILDIFSCMRKIHLNQFNNNRTIPTGHCASPNSTLKEKLNTLFYIPIIKEKLEFEVTP